MPSQRPLSTSVLTAKPSKPGTGVFRLLSLPPELLVEILRCLLLVSRNCSETRIAHSISFHHRRIRNAEKLRVCTLHGDNNAHVLRDDFDIFLERCSLQPVVLRLNRELFERGSRILYQENRFVALRNCYSPLSAGRSELQTFFGPFPDDSPTFKRLDFETTDLDALLERMTSFSVEPLAHYNLGPFWDKRFLAIGPWRTFLIPVEFQECLTRFLWEIVQTVVVLGGQGPGFIDIHIRNNLRLPGLPSTVSATYPLMSWPLLPYLGKFIGEIKCCPQWPASAVDEDLQQRLRGRINTIHTGPQARLYYMEQHMQKLYSDANASIHVKEFPDAERKIKMLIYWAAGILCHERSFSRSYAVLEPELRGFAHRITCLLSLALVTLARMYKDEEVSEKVNFVDEETRLLTAIEYLTLARRLPRFVPRAAWKAHIGVDIASSWSGLKEWGRVWKEVDAVVRILTPTNLGRDQATEWRRREKQKWVLTWQGLGLRSLRKFKERPDNLRPTEKDFWRELKSRVTDVFSKR